ncbi:type II secretion system protein [Dielma fastidiosa]|uniref:Prepilin-type N-terminal cleavage/methylation domain-containing protein n=1 Tax=Dielma fastidiosa TaxID=1034346 RepID=A0A318KMC4_9FIRM|nr:type II secretion system protein [Dielma fastidiosa]PXX77592.1 prepilin-type N-terminal cleavage/methylation domain-containing protein [Dielma fastidiosa]
MKTKKGFTLIELIVVIAILGILALFLVPSFMGYARDAKIQIMKANVRTGQGAYSFALTKYEEEKNEAQQKKLIEKEVCDNMGDIACYFIIDGKIPSMTEYPRVVFSVGSEQGLDGSTVTYYLDEKNYCVYLYVYGNGKDMWFCTINGKELDPEEAN